MTCRDVFRDQHTTGTWKEGMFPRQAADKESREDPISSFGRNLKPPKFVQNINFVLTYAAREFQRLIWMQKISFPYRTNEMFANGIGLVLKV